MTTYVLVGGAWIGGWCYEPDPIVLPKEENLFETVRYVSPSLRHEITWLVLPSIVVLTGVGALCFGWWLPGVILIVGGGAPAGAVLCASSLSARWSDR